MKKSAILFFLGASCLLALVPTTASSRKARSVLEVRPGYRHACALTDDGSLYCWGSNATGVLGMGDAVNRTSPEVVPTSETLAVTSADAGFDAQCAAFEDGALKCWGANAQGKLGLGTPAANVGRLEDETVEELAAVNLGKNAKVNQIRLGSTHACALLENGQVKCWGANESGQLGLGDVRARGRAAADMGDALDSVNLGKGAAVADLCLGTRHTCTRLSDGTVKCWGKFEATGSGKKVNVGIKAGDMGDSLVAVPLGKNAKVRELGCGTDFVCALLDTGAVKCWGRNITGRLGVGSADNNLVIGDDLAEMGDALAPVRLGTGLEATAISCGRDHCCALLENGALKCWGGNAYGQLGTGDREVRGTSTEQMGDNLAFVSLGKLASVKKFWAGGFHSCAQLTNGRYKCWGRNREKQVSPAAALDVGVTPEQMGENLPYLEFPPEKIRE